MKTKWTKRLLSGFLSLMMLVCLIPTSAMAAQPNDWNVDAEAKTVSIYTATGLREWADSVRESNNRYDGYTISIENDIDLSGENWASIISLGGNVTIDGNNHTISNMTISEQENGSDGNTYLGFIGNLNYNTKLTVQNITFTNAHVQDLTGDGEYSWCGVVVGHGPMDGVDASQAECTFTNVNIVNSVVTGGHNNGAIMGYSCSTETGHLFENCSVTDTFVGGYNSTSGILFGMGIANVTVRNCSADGVRLYTDGLNFDCSQSRDDQLWLGNVYPYEIYGDRYGSNGTATYEGTNTATDSYVVYPVLYHYADSDVQEYVQVNSEDALAPVTANWYSDEDCTNPVTKIVADLTDTDMYPYGKQSIANNQTYDTQDTDNVANPLTHGAIELYTNEKNPGKTSYPGLDKKVSDENEPYGDDADTEISAAAGQEVNFSLTSNVPTDLLNYLNPDDVDPPVVGDGQPGEAAPGVPTDPNRGSYVLTFHDQMNDMLLNPESFSVTIGGRTLDGDYYFVYTDEDELNDDCDFEVVIDLVRLYENGIITKADIENSSEIVVGYNATLSQDASNGKFENTSWVTYPEGHSEEDIVYVNTYAINIFKYDQATDAALPGAAFTLYSNVNCTDDSAIDTVSSGDNGDAVFDGLDAGTYYLKETKAPEGYVCSSEVVTIEIPGNDVGANNIVSVKFANSQIPHTGGMGTTLFSIVGGVLIAMAGTIFVISRRRKARA